MNGLLGYTGEERGELRPFKGVATALQSPFQFDAVFGCSDYIFNKYVHEEGRVSYLSSMWQELQEVIFSKVCIRNSWKLLVAFSGRMFDLSNESKI